jgi:small subunit ribosomal protein S9
MAEAKKLTTGKRKTAIARIIMVPGTGKVTVNGRDMDAYFGRPFEVTSTAGKYDVSVNVNGGGLSGQAGAIRHAISKVLITINPDFKVLLRKFSLMTRDSRKKERKKYGQKGARKRFQYSKR